MENVGGVEQPKRYVGIFFVLAAIGAGFFLENAVAKLLAALRVNDPAVLFGWNLSTLIGFGVAALAAVVIWRMPKAQNAGLEVALELRRVTWPSLRETRAATVAVIVASAIAAVILGLFDFAWSWLSQQLY
jgi:preprotein translocase subunit SecE